MWLVVYSQGTFGKEREKKKLKPLENLWRGDADGVGA